MLHFKEELLHFVWQSKLLLKHPLKLTDGEELQVIHPGIYNHDAGPDFLNAQIKIGSTIWAGQIEFHIRSSDWNLHKHHIDAAYNNVILHVVYQHNEQIFYPSGKPIPTLELMDLLPPIVLKRYQYLKKSKSTIPCQQVFLLPDNLKVTHWMQRLLINRLEHKTEAFELLLHQTHNNWEVAFYIFTARYLGMKTNAFPFELLAQQLPMQIVAKHKNSLFQLRALCLGVAGFLENNDWPEYEELKSEFRHLKQKYQLVSLHQSQWKFARTRPANFPNIRVEQFALLLSQSSHLFSKVLEAENISHLNKLYQFKQEEKQVFSSTAIDLLLINSVIPVLFLYGKMMRNPDLEERALRLYEEIKAEQNKVIAFWESLGLDAKNAADSQALIELKTVFCDYQQCLSCTFGQHLLLHEASS